MYDWNAPLRSRFFARIQCSFEGGKKCTREDPDAQTKSTSPIPGLHADWVDGRLLAMARPWEQNLIANDNALIKRMHTEGLRLVLNLQEFGEHARCGPGLAHRSGFSYRPETFMQHGIKHTCLAWLDMSVPSLKRISDIVHVIDSVVGQGGRVAVHCHAGLGRTGLVCAAYMVYRDGMDPSAAVALVRKNRPGAIQTERQEAFVHAFSVFMRYLRLALPPVAPPDPEPSAAPENSPGDKLRPKTPARHSQLMDDGSSEVGPSGASLHPIDLPWDHRLRMRSWATAACSRLPSSRLPYPRTLEEHLARQRFLLHGEELRHHWGSPFLLNRCLEGVPAVAGAHGLPAVLRCLAPDLPLGSSAAALTPATREAAMVIAMVDLRPADVLGLVEALLGSLAEAPLSPAACLQGAGLFRELMDPVVEASGRSLLTATVSTSTMMLGAANHAAPTLQDTQMCRIVDALHDQLSMTVRSLLACSLGFLRSTILSLARNASNPLDAHRAAFLLCHWLARNLTRDGEAPIAQAQVPTELLASWGERFLHAPGADTAVPEVPWTPWSLLIYGTLAMDQTRFLRTRKGAPGSAAQPKKSRKSQSGGAVPVHANASLASVDTTGASAAGTAFEAFVFPQKNAAAAPAMDIIAESSPIHVDAGLRETISVALADRPIPMRQRSKKNARLSGGAKISLEGRGSIDSQLVGVADPLWLSPALPHHETDLDRGMQGPGPPGPPGGSVASARPSAGLGGLERVRSE